MAVARLLCSEAAADPQCPPDEREYLAQRALGELLGALVRGHARDAMQACLGWMKVNARVLRDEPDMPLPARTFRLTVEQSFSLFCQEVLESETHNPGPVGAKPGSDIQAAELEYRGGPVQG